MSCPTSSASGVDEDDGDNSRSSSITMITHHMAASHRIALYSVLASALILLSFVPVSAFCQDVPYLGGRVNDTAGLLSPETVRHLETILKQHEDSTSNQVVVLTIPSLNGEVLEEYSIKVAETWKLGQADKDNGVLLLIVTDDRKLRIEVGRGLEGALTDALCSRIIRHEIVPRFRDGEFDLGVEQGVDAILAAIRGQYVAEEWVDTGSEDFVVILLAMLMFLIVVGLFTFIGMISKGFMGWFLYVFLMPFWLAFPYGFLGTFIPFIVYIVLFPVGRVLLARLPAFKTLQMTWGTAGGSGSRWSRGSSGGGWSSGGGFSGGGGGFSGGGSSGSW